MKKRKPEIITFKVDHSIREALSGVPNRSDFIRTAILNALNDICPLCQGAGSLSTHQKDHWETFMQDHTLKECDSCLELHLVCSNSSAKGKSK